MHKLNSNEMEPKTLRNIKMNEQTWLRNIIHEQLSLKWRLMTVSIAFIEFVSSSLLLIEFNQIEKVEILTPSSIA